MGLELVCAHGRLMGVDHSTKPPIETSFELPSEYFCGKIRETPIFDSSMEVPWKLRFVLRLINETSTNIKLS